jgi:hypothetical protein
MMIFDIRLRGRAGAALAINRYQGLGRGNRQTRQIAFSRFEGFGRDHVQKTKSDIRRESVGDSGLETVVFRCRGRCQSAGRTCSRAQGFSSGGSGIGAACADCEAASKDGNRFSPNFERV